MQTRVSSLPSSVKHYLELSWSGQKKETTAHHLAVDGIYSRALLLMWQEQDGFSGWLRCLNPPVRLLKNVRHVRWYGIVVFDHLLQGKHVERRVLVECTFCCKGAVSGVMRRAKKRVQAIRASMRLFFSSLLRGPWKNAPRTEYMRVWSPGARVGQAWLNVEAINGNSVCESFGSGIAQGIFGLAVAEVGGGGKERKSESIPGINSATTFCTERAFWGTVGMLRDKKQERYLDLDPVGRWCICDDVEDEITYILGASMMRTTRTVGRTYIDMDGVLSLDDVAVHVHEPWRQRLQDKLCVGHATASARHTLCLASTFLAFLALRRSTRVHSASPVVASSRTLGFLCCGETGSGGGDAAVSWDRFIADHECTTQHAVSRQVTRPPSLHLTRPPTPLHVWSLHTPSSRLWMSRAAHCTMQRAWGPTGTSKLH